MCAQKFLFWTMPCVYISYLLYIALFVISLILLLVIDWDWNGKAKRRVRRLISRKKLERRQEFEKLRQVYDPDCPNYDGKFSKEYLNIFEEITSLPFQELRGRLQSGKYTATQTLHAFIAKTLRETEKLNCVTDFNPQAYEIAARLDERFKEQGTVSDLPLFGIPVAIKDDHDVQGLDTTLGLGQNLGRPAESSAALVNSLLDLGAVIFCKTNIPQAILSNGGCNPIFGETKNPLNPLLSPAGSSAGSASLVGAGGTLIATGSDFGGSLRAPAHYCGVSSIKPTIGRLSGQGIKACQPAVGLTSVPGILAKNSETISFVLKHLISNGKQHEIDNTCPPIPWNEEVFKSGKKMRIGYFTSLEIFPSMGDTALTVLSAKEALEAEGHVLTPFQMPDSLELDKIFCDLSFADAGQFLKPQMSKEPEISPDFSETWPTLYMSRWRYQLQVWLTGQPWYPGHSKRVAKMMKGDAHESVDLWKYWRRRNEIRTQVLKRMKADELDALICPVFALPAIKPEDTRKLILSSYTMIWSVLDFPVGVTRFGTESGQNLEYDDEGDSLLKLGKQAFPSSIGMPIGLQVISQPFHEETVLKLMCLLDSLYEKID